VGRLQRHSLFDEMTRVLVLVALAACQRAPAEPPLATVTVPARAASGEKPAVLVLLHGLGANEQNLLALADELDPRFELVGVRAPITVGENRYGWFHTSFTPSGPVHNTAELEVARVRLVTLLETLRARGRRVYVLGFSQGAMMALTVALTAPKQVDGVIAIAGMLDASQATAAGRGGPPVLVLHGTQDTVIPFATVATTQAVLKARGVPFTFQSYPAGHEVSAQMRADLRAWSTAQLDMDSP
jgi:phospholipase/carboxylesterase